MKRLLGALGLAVMIVAVGQAAQAASVCGTWEEMSTPNPGYPGNVLNSVATWQGRETWAVGYMTGSRTPLALRMGTTAGLPGWQVEPIPFSATQAVLSDVSIAPAGDVWTVGAASGVSGGDVPFAMRWRNGAWDFETTSEAGPLPQQGLTHGAFRGAAALGADDVWMVGEQAVAVHGRRLGTSVAPLAMHWDGSQLSAVPMPWTAGRAYSLKAVAGAQSGDVWAVGQARDAAGSRAVIYHWDGHAWTVVAHPADSLMGSLSDVVAFASDDVWAVGELTDFVGNTLTIPAPEALYLHWDGKQWERVDGPVGAGPIRAVAGVGGDDIWTTGANGYSHWDGQAWRLFGTPAVSQVADRNSLVVMGACDVIGVGATTRGAWTLTLAERLRPADAPADPGTADATVPADSGPLGAWTVPADPGPVDDTTVPADPGPAGASTVPADPGPVDDTTVPADPGPAGAWTIPADPGPVDDTTVPADPGPVGGSTVPADPGPVGGGATTAWSKRHARPQHRSAWSGGQRRTH